MKVRPKDSLKELHYIDEYHAFDKYAVAINGERVFNPFYKRGNTWTVDFRKYYNTLEDVKKDYDIVEE